MKRFRSVLAGLLALAFVTPWTLAQESVDVSLDTFGVGNNFRPGDVTAAKIIISNALTEATNVWVQWEIPNADGDIAEYWRDTVLNPGQDTELWLYAPLPPRTDNQTVWSIRVFEYRDGRRLGEIGGARISPALANSSTSEISQDLIAVVNQGDMGLNYYAGGMDPRSGNKPLSAPESVVTIGNLKPSDLPDRWYGLTPFQVIVWGDENPNDLTTDAAAGLREWIRRGGHLAVVLPRTDTLWGMGNELAQHELADLMPPSPPTEMVDVHFSELLPVLSKRVDPTFYTRNASVAGGGMLTIKSFPDIESSTKETNWFEPVMQLPTGDTIAVTRTYGHGRITFIGLPLSTGLIRTLGLPQADIFWNDILGRRVDTPTAEELGIIDRDLAQLIRTAPREVDLGSGALFSEQINMNREAAAGLLLSLFLFVVYWIVAGPGGFAALKIYKQQHHAWIAFAGAAALFTAIAWMGVALTKANDVQLKHVTFLDRIAGNEDRENDEQIDRASSWMNVYLPGYGPTSISIDVDGAPRDLLYSWQTPGVATNPFPNADRYSVNVGRDFASAQIPARATSTQIRANWLGLADPNYGGIRGRNIEQRIEADRDIGFASGELLHDFPIALADAQIIIVTNRRNTPIRYAQNEDGYLPHVPSTQSGLPRVQAFMWSLPDPWEPGAAIDLTQYATTGGQGRLEAALEDRYVKPEVGGGFTGMSGTQVRGLNTLQQRRYMEVLSLFNQIPPPQYVKARERDPNPEQATFYREVGRELDLSGWFVEPCIIIIGYLRGADCPVPIRVGGETPETDPDSLTVVRWIYPLTQQPKILFDNMWETEAALSAN